jgi:hypothetical protein
MSVGAGVLVDCLALLRCTGDAIERTEYYCRRHTARIQFRLWSGALLPAK